MNRTSRWIAGGALAAGAVAAAAIAVSSGVATASSHDGGDAETPITGDALDKATAAALAHTGGGRVTDTEVGDEEGYYEVEVTLPSGRQVDVHLDRDFTVQGSDSDPNDSRDDADPQ